MKIDTNKPEFTSPGRKGASEKMQSDPSKNVGFHRVRASRRVSIAHLALYVTAGVFLCQTAAVSAQTAAVEDMVSSEDASLDKMRLSMDKWIETQQIISKERKDWQQGKEILAGRLDLLKGEIDRLKEKIEEAKSGAVESNVKHKELADELDGLKAAGDRLSGAAGILESETRNLFIQLPEPIQTKLKPLYDRIPENPAVARVSAAERFQNVLGILNELNKANSEISVNYEVHTLADGKPAEVKVIYVGLAQAYYVSARGEAGVGRPMPDGWKWSPSESSTRDILLALEILQGKHTPAFVPVPMRIQ